MWEIKLIVETDDEVALERITNMVARAACPVPLAEMTDAHTCEVPWMMITSPVSDDDASEWRGHLNR